MVLHRNQLEGDEQKINYCFSIIYFLETQTFGK